MSLKFIKMTYFRCTYDSFDNELTRLLPRDNFTFRFGSKLVEFGEKFKNAKIERENFSQKI